MLTPLILVIAIGTLVTLSETGTEAVQSPTGTSPPAVSQPDEPQMATATVPAPPPVQAPEIPTKKSISNVSGTVWNINETGKRFIEYNFRPDGSVHYWDNRYWKNGQWKQKGSTVYVNVNAGYAKYVGTITGDVMTIKASNIKGTKWGWSMKLAERSCGPIGDAVLNAYTNKHVDLLKAKFSSKPLDINWGSEHYYAWDSRSTAKYASERVCIFQVQVDTKGTVIASDIQGYPCSCAAFETSAE